MQTHTTVLFGTNVGEFLKADHSWLCFWQPASLKVVGKFHHAFICAWQLPETSQVWELASDPSQETLRAGDSLSLENEALETTQKREAIGFQKEQTVQRKALFSGIK